ncbi:MAG: PTS transporter subunit EIIA [Proteobacteria bacterium]|nr:PTS transporter subunit EIIA [Pseudomonadota bacterium]
MKYKTVNLKSINKVKIIKELITASGIKKEYKGNLINEIIGFEKRFNKSFWDDYVMLRYISDKIEESEVILGFSQAGMKYNYYDNELKHIFLLLIIGDDCKEHVELITFYRKLLSDEEMVTQIIESKGENIFEGKFLFKPEETKK